MASSSQIEYSVTPGRVGFHSVALILGDEDPAEQLVQDAIGTLSTDIMVKAGGVTMHLAAWMDPDHWETDWDEALGDESFEDYVARLVEERSAR